MKQAVLKNPAGKEIATINLPESLADVPLNRYVDFLTESRRLREGGNYVACMAKAVGAFYGLDLKAVMETQVGDLATTDPKAFDGTLATLFGYASKLMAGFKSEIRTPETAAFTHKGQTFKIPVILQQALAGEVLLPDVETIEAIEALEVQRLTLDNVDANRALRKKELMADGVDMDGLRMLVTEGKATAGQIEELENAERELEAASDPDGNLSYGQHLRLLAILARKDGEHLPISDGEREAFLSERLIFFQDIDAATALDVDFFFQNFLPRSEKSPRVAGSLSQAHFGQVAETLFRKGGLTTGRRRGMRKFSERSGGGSWSSPFLKKTGSTGRIAAR